jgi:pimeloyl-ACP methyl ester carboxylesterase
VAGGQVRDVVLLHGLWFRADFMTLLARRLRAAGFAVHLFNYRSTSTPLERSARRLDLFLQRQLPGGAHLVGHSLGGVLIAHTLSHSGWAAPGRMLFMGSPLQGSTVAKRVLGWPGAPRLLGHARQPLGQPLDSWPEGREAGMIAGDLALGLGRVTGRLPGPNDGTVCVDETRHPGLSDHLVLPVTHTGMIYSPLVARQAAAFLHNGRFDRPLPG